MTLQTTIRNNYLKALDSNQKRADSVRGQYLEKVNSSKKVSCMISSFSEEKPKFMPCRTAITPTENFRIFGMKNQKKDSGQLPQKEK